MDHERSSAVGLSLSVRARELTSQAQDLNTTRDTTRDTTRNLTREIGGYPMLFEGYVATDIWKLETARMERRAAEKWRFRHCKSRESQIATAVVTAVLGLFVR